MSDNYTQGTVSISKNSHAVTGQNTAFKSIGLVQAGSLLTLDGDKFYLIHDVISDTELYIEQLMTRGPFSEATVTNVSYTIVKSFARQTNTGLAADFVAFQNQLLTQKFQFFSWMNAATGTYSITSPSGDTQEIITPKGIDTLFNELANGIVQVGALSGTWDNIADDAPETAKRWPKFSEVTDKPVYSTRWPKFSEITGDLLPLLPATATRWPAFREVTGTLGEDQLPETVKTHRGSLADSPPIKRELNLTQVLTDYPTLKKTEERPTESPNNRRLIEFDDVRNEVHISMTDKWFTIPTIIASRSFPIFFRGLILRFNNSQAYTGVIKLRVYPMGKGGEGLPNNPPFINDHEWQEYETTVTDLYKIGEFGGKYFEGIIEYVETEKGWHQFDANQSDVSSLNAKFDVAFGTYRSPFRTFYQRTDGHWYSENMAPETPNSIGPSWVQSPSNPFQYTVTDATSGSDALRFFGDSYDDFQFELIVDVTYVTHPLAVTVSNSSDHRIHYPGPVRFITDERIFFKRAGSKVSAAITIESLKMRIPHYG